MGKYIGKKILWAIIYILAASILIFAIIYFASNPLASIPLEKPVIYLYPESETDVLVWLHLDGQLGLTYPAYEDGWHVTAYPNGKLINHADGAEYGYLFWEGAGCLDFDMSSGFVVAGSDTVDFLREKLEFMGLNPNEYIDFIVYWAPRMQSNAYNLIAFQKDAYTDSAKLEVVPTPDSVLRVFMAFKPLDNPIAISEQELETFERTGFTVVEWGGAEVH